MHIVFSVSFGTAQHGDVKFTSSKDAHNLTITMHILSYK